MLTPIHTTASWVLDTETPGGMTPEVWANYQQHLTTQMALDETPSPEEHRLMYLHTNPWEMNNA